MRRSGLALMGSGLLLILAVVLDSMSELSTVMDQGLIGVLPLPPLLLLLAALPRVTDGAGGSSPTGGLGGIGFVLTVMGLLMVVSAFFVVTLFPDESDVGEVSYLVGGCFLLVGTLMFALATRRAGLFPRGGSLLLILGWLGFWLSLAVDRPPIFFTPALCLFAGGWIWLGYMLVTERPAVLAVHEVAARETKWTPPPPP